MIHINSIELKNFGKHAHFRSSADANVVGLIGASGCGKSTILQALQFALSGRIEHEDSLVGFVRRTGSGAAKSAEVTVEFSSDGIPCRMVRVIRPSGSTTRSLVVGDGDPIESDKAVQAKMSELLKVDRNALNTSVFIPQGAFAQIFGDANDRIEFYTRLLLLSHMQGVSEKIDNVRKSVQSGIVDLRPALDEAQSALAAATSSYEEAEAAVEGGHSYAEEIDNLQALSAGLSHLANAEEAFRNATAEYASRAELGDPVKDNAETQRLESELQRLEIDLRRCDESISRLQAAERTRRARASALESSERVSAKYSELEKYREDNSEILSKVKTPTDAPRAVIAACQARKLTRPRAEKLLVDASAANTEIETLQARLPSLTDARAACEKVSSECREDYKKVDRDLKEVRTLIASAAGSECCKMCGSSNFAASYLDQRSAYLSAQLESIAESGKAKAAELANAQAAEKAASEELVRLTKSWQVIQNELLRLGDYESWPSAESDAIAEAQADRELREAEAFNLEIEQAQKQELVLAATCTALGAARPTHEEVAALREDLAAAEIELTDARAAVDDSSDAEILRAKVTAAESRLLSTRSLIQRTTESRSAVTRADESVAKALNVCVAMPKLRERLVELGQPTDSDIRSLLIASREDAADFARKQGALNLSKKVLAESTDRVTELETRIAETNSSRILVDKLAKLRAAFMPTGAVGNYLKHHFNEMSGLVADYLSACGADFTVTPSQDIPLAYDFMSLSEPDAAWLPQSRMSGGQRVRLAVVTLLAIHARLLPDLGLLVLDEPTTHVHEEAVETMADMFRQIGESGKLQLIICDHHPALTESFQTVIRVGA